MIRGVTILVKYPKTKIPFVEVKHFQHIIIV